MAQRPRTAQPARPSGLRRASDACEPPSPELEPRASSPEEPSAGSATGTGGSARAAAPRRSGSAGLPRRSTPWSKKTIRLATCAREAHLVGDDEHRHARPGQLAHDLEHLVDHLGVERRGRLVEQHDLRLHGQRAGDRHALLLTAGQLGRDTCAPARGCRPARAAAWPASSAASRDRRRTFIGARVMFWSTVRCGNRLNDWNTMPISLRMAAMLRMSLVSSMPSTMISPRWCSSSRLMVRMKVDLPEPDAPKMTTTSPRLHGQVDPAQHVELAEPLVHVARDDDVAGDAAAVGSGPSSGAMIAHHACPPRAALQTVAGLGHRVAQDEEDGGDEDVDLHVRRRSDSGWARTARPMPSSSSRPMIDDQGRVLEQADEEADVGRDDGAQRLRQDDVQVRLEGRSGRAPGPPRSGRSGSPAARRARSRRRRRPRTG